MSAAAVLSVQGLVVLHDGRRTIDRLDLRVGAGCVYALLGGNGAGKTTTLNALLGFATAYAGEVRVAGLRVADDAGATRRLLSYMPENVALYEHLSGLENLRYFCALGGQRVDAARADALLDAAGLAEGSRPRRVRTYSKGMRQKVGLAIAHARQARALLLDEPTSGLDPSAADDLARRVRAAAAGGMAVLMATHDLLNACETADRIGIMKAGRLVDELDAHEIDHESLARRYLDITRRIEVEA